MQPVSNFKEISCGRSGSGKTFKTKQMIVERSQGLCLVYDTQGEFFRPDKAAGYPGPDYNVANWQDFHLLTTQNLQKPLDKSIVAFDPIMSEVIAGDGFVEWLETLKSARMDQYREHGQLEDRILVVCDEFDSIGNSASCDPRLIATIKISRRLGIDFLLCAHRLNEVHPKLRAQITKLHQFAVEEKNTLDLLETYGITRAQIAALKPEEHEYVTKIIN